jgi:lysine-N-methylase
MASAWIAEAAQALLSPAVLEAALRAADPARGGLLPGELQADPDADAFYLRAVLHGHQLVAEAPLAMALRDRAIRILLGRSLGAVLARLAPEDAARDHPLTLVEAMMRGHGLGAYVREVGPSHRRPADA